MTIQKLNPSRGEPFYVVYCLRRGVMSYARNAAPDYRNDGDWAHTPIAAAKFNTRFKAWRVALLFELRRMVQRLCRRWGRGV